MKKKAKVAASSAAQDDVLQRRRNNLRTAAAQRGGVTGLAKVLGYDGPSYLSQMIGPSHNRPISERTARHIEHKLGMPVGFLDQDHAALVPITEDAPPRVVPIDEPLFAVVADALRDSLRSTRANLTREKAHAVFIRVYTEAQRTGEVDPNLIRDLIALAS